MRPSLDWNGQRRELAFPILIYVSVGWSGVLATIALSWSEQTPGLHAGGVALVGLFVSDGEPCLVFWCLSLSAANLG